MKNGKFEFPLLINFRPLYFLSEMGPNDDQMQHLFGLTSVRQKGLGMVHFLLQSAPEATAEAAAEQVVEAVVTAHNEALFGQALQITLIGMLILFVSLFILWGVMELLVRLVKDDPKKKAEEAEAVETADAGDDDEKLKAAAAAAAYVIAKK